MLSDRQPARSFILNYPRALVFTGKKAGVQENTTVSPAILISSHVISADSFPNLNPPENHGDLMPYVFLFSQSSYLNSLGSCRIVVCRDRGFSVSVARMASISLQSYPEDLDRPSGLISLSLLLSKVRPNVFLLFSYFENIKVLVVIVLLCVFELFETSSFYLFVRALLSYKIFHNMT